MILCFNQSMRHDILKAFLLSVRPGEDVTEEEEILERKVKPKPRHSKNHATGGKPSTMSKTTTQTSKYFSVKDKEFDSEDDFDMESSPARPVGVNNKKVEKDDEGDEDSEEDEDDWEEVEGRPHISFACCG